MNGKNVYISDTTNYVIRVLDGTGEEAVVAGHLTLGLSGDGGPATKAQLLNNSGVAADAAGNIYIVDFGDPFAPGGATFSATLSDGSNRSSKTAQTPVNLINSRLTVHGNQPLCRPRRLGTTPP